MVAGYDTLETSSAARAAMGVQLQSTSFQPELNVSEILQLFASIYGRKAYKGNAAYPLREINLADAENKKFRTIIRRAAAKSIVGYNYHT